MVMAMMQGSLLKFGTFSLGGNRQALPIKKSLVSGRDDIGVNNPQRLSLRGRVRNQLTQSGNPRHFCFMSLLAVLPSSLAPLGFVSVNILGTADDLFPLSLSVWIYIFLLLEYKFFRALEEDINVWIQSIILTWKFRIQFQEQFWLPIFFSIQISEGNYEFFTFCDFCQTTSLRNFLKKVNKDLRK